MHKTAYVMRMNDWSSDVCSSDLGRIITAPFSFKEIDPEDPAGLPRYVSDEERCRRVAGLAVNHARLRHLAPADRKLEVLLSAQDRKRVVEGTSVSVRVGLGGRGIFQHKKINKYTETQTTE